MERKFSILVIFFLIFNLSSANDKNNIVKIWEKTFGGKGWDKAYSIVETKDGGYVIAGETESFGVGWNDLWVIKIDKNGNKIWEKTFGGKDNDGAKCIIQTKDNGYFIVGYTKSFGAGNSDVWVIKIDKNGNKLWDKTFGGKSSDLALSAIETEDGGYIIVGDTGSYGAGGLDIWVIKIDKNGDKVWDKTFGSKYSDGANSVIKTKEGNYIIAGYIWSGDVGWEDVWIIKIDKNGNKLWDKKFGGKSSDMAYSVIETEGGNYIIAGYTWSFGVGKSDVWIIKVDKTGNKLWDKTFGGKDDDRAYSIIKTKDDKYIFVGKTNGDAWIVNIDKNGNKVWDKTFGGEDGDEVYSILDIKDGNYTIIGDTWSYGAGKGDVWVIKFKP